MKIFSMTMTMIVLLFVAPFAFALEAPPVGQFLIKKVKDQNILYAVHTEDKGHISSTVVKLVQYYLLQDNARYEVVFPQMSLESRAIQGTYVAIAYKGQPKPTREIKLLRLEGGMFASYVYKGSYKHIGKAIRNTFRQVLKTGKYIPDDKEEIRLLYWNSIDDHHPKDLITEIQVKVAPLP